MRRRAAQAHAFDPMMGLEVRKAHLNLLTLVAGFGKLGRTHQSAGVIASIVVEIAWDLA